MLKCSACIPLLILSSLFVCLFTVSGLAASSANAPISFVDDSGHAIVLAAPARRIVPLYSACTEILLKMGQAERIVGRTAADATLPADLPGRDRVASLPAVGTHMLPNLELVYGLKPDLVVQLQGREEASQAAEALRALGVQVAVFRVRNFEDLFRVIDTLGLACGATAEAAALERNLRQRLCAVQAKLDISSEQRAKARVFYELRYPNLIAAGPDTITSAIIEAAGGVNCLNELYGEAGWEKYAGLVPDSAASGNASSNAAGNTAVAGLSAGNSAVDKLAAGNTAVAGLSAGNSAVDKLAAGFLSRRVARLSEEVLLVMDPDVYLIQQGPMNKHPQPFDERPHFAVLKAGKTGRVLLVDEEIFARPGPRNVQAVEKLAKFLYPDLFP